MTGIEPLLMAMILVESSGRQNVPPGDAGMSHGPLQIKRIYFDDAVAQLEKEKPGVGRQFRYPRDVQNEKVARALVRAYWRRWVPKAYRDENLEVLARTHVGGPRGAKRKSSLPYWKRVKAELEREK